MGARLRAAIGATLLVALLGGLPVIASQATAVPTPRVVTVATHDLEPFVMTQGAIKSGFTIDLLEAIAKREDWTLSYVDVANVAEQLKAVSDRRVDAAATAISITADRTKDYDFSQPILNSGLQIMVPTSKLEQSTPGLRDFLNLVFSKMMAIWLAAGLLVSVLPAHIIWLSERRHEHPMVPKSYFAGSSARSDGVLACSPGNLMTSHGTR